MKELVTQASILQVADPNSDYIVSCNINDLGMRAVLSQIHEDRGHPIAFESRKMTQTECNNPINKRELLIAIHALKTWRHYLDGSKFKIIMNHHSLKYFMMQPNLLNLHAR